MLTSLGIKVVVNSNSQAFRSLITRLKSTVAAAATTNLITPKVLKAKDVETFDRDGFVVLNDLLTTNEKQLLVKWTNEIQSWAEIKGKWFLYFENIKGKRTLCRTENFVPYHEGINSLIRGKLSAAMSDLFREPAVLFKEKINYKLSGAGGFPPHQDAPAYVAFNQKLHMTMMLAADPMTVENGCLEFVKGEHTKGTFPQNESDGSMKQEIVEKMKWEPAVTDIGAVMIFNSYVPHRSGPNSSNTSRRAYYLTFNALSEGNFRDGYYREKREKFPPEIEREKGKDYSEGAKIYNLATPIK